MPTYEVFEASDPHTPIGQLDGEIEGASFRGRWDGSPVQYPNKMLWTLKLDGESVLDGAWLTWVDAYDVGRQFLAGQGTPL
jgi:hypothetical protein